jgi:prevent-host-death family protein
MKLISSRDFNQDVSRAKRAARLEPVFVTDRGKPSHVLISIEEWRRLSGEKESLVDLLAMADPAGIEPDPDAAATWNRAG